MPDETPQDEADQEADTEGRGPQSPVRRVLVRVGRLPQSAFTLWNRYLDNQVETQRFFDDEYEKLKTAIREASPPRQSRLNE